MLKNYLKFIFAIVFATNVMAQNVPSYVPKDGLVGWWPFNGNANDESGRGDHGKVNNCKLVKDRFGKENSAYYFNKNYSYIELNDENHPQISIATWIKLSNLKDTNALISKGNSWLSDNRSYMNYYAWGLNLTQITVDKDFNYLDVSYNDTSYHFIVIVYDQKSIKYYQDGIFIKESSNTQGPIKSTSQNKYLGALMNGNEFSTDYFLHGTMDEFSMWNRALTDKEIQALFEGNPCPITAAISPQGSVNICEGSSIVLQSSDTTHSFQWFKDEQPISGATSKSYTATKAGHYTLKVSDATCSSISPVTTIDTIPLPDAPLLSNNYQKVCGIEPIEEISRRLTNYNSAIILKWYRNETGTDSISKYMPIEPYPKNYFVSQLSATSPQCESQKRTMVFIDVAIPAIINAKGNTSFCKGDSVVLEAFTNGNSYDYAWKKDFNWIEGTEGKNTFVAKEAGRYSYQNKMCGMQMNGGNEIQVFIREGLKVNVGKITSSSIEFVWDTLSLSPTPRGFDISYGINSKSLTEKISIPGATSYVFTGLNKGDTVRVSITPKGPECTNSSFAIAVTLDKEIPSNIPTDGLIGYWPFNGNANDESGNGNHGKVNGATLTEDRNGKANSAYSFDGVSSFIDINESSTLKFEKNNAISVSFYAKFGDNGNCILFSKQTNNGINQDGWNIALENNILYLLVKKGNDSEQGYVRTEIYQFKDNKWHNFVFIFNNNKGHVFGDGQQLFNGTTASAIVGDNFSNMSFGKPNWQDEWLYKGQLDDIAIYNRALSDQEVKQLYGTNCAKETATSNSFSYPSLTTSSPITLNAEPQGGVFTGFAIENNQFIPKKGKIGLNKVQYNFKNSQGCNDSTEFNMIIADTSGTKCIKYDTITITNKVTIYDTITIKNNVYDTVTITKNVTKYDTITLTDTVSILKIKFKLTTGIQANQILSMNLYPNPTSDVLHIEIGDAKALEGYRYRILDVQGKEVYNELVKNKITEIPLKLLGAAGMYQFEVLDEKNTRIQTNKIVLQ